MPLLKDLCIREGNRIRVHAQLIRAATDEHFWSEEYDRELRDVLALQSDGGTSDRRKSQGFGHRPGARPAGSRAPGVT